MTDEECDFPVCMATLNNQAVSHYQAGYYKESLVAFTNILMSLQKQGALERGDEVSQGKRILSVSAVIEVLSPDELPHSGDNIFPFYQVPFVMKSHSDSNHSASLLSNEEDQLLQFAVIAYNAALAHHTIAIDQDSEFHFQKACRLYQITFKAMVEDWDCSNKGALLLLLAVCSNLGFIQSHFKNFVAVNDCIGILNELSDFYARQDESLLTTDEYLFFFMTAMLLNGEPLNMAPAA